MIAAELQEMLERGDEKACVAWFDDLTESQRRELARPLADWFRGPMQPLLHLQACLMH